MDNQSEMKELLIEIRDIQLEHLQEYKNASQRVIQIQKSAMRRQAFGLVFLLVFLLAIGYFAIQYMQRQQENPNGWYYYGPDRSSRE